MMNSSPASVRMLFAKRLFSPEGLSVADLDGEAVVLDSLKGRYFGLNEVGARILSLMQEPRPVDELVELVSQEYDISRDRLERDVLAFLSKLESRSLVQVSDIVR